MPVDTPGSCDFCGANPRRSDCCRVASSTPISAPGGDGCTNPECGPAPHTHAPMAWATTPENVGKNWDGSEKTDPMLRGPRPDLHVVLTECIARIGECYGSEQAVEASMALQKVLNKTPKAAQSDG